MAGALPFDADAVAYGLFTNLNQSQLWQQNENVVFEQSRNVVLTAPSFGDAGRTTTDDPSR